MFIRRRSWFGLARVLLAAKAQALLLEAGIEQLALLRSQCIQSSGKPVSHLSVTAFRLLLSESRPDLFRREVFDLRQQLFHFQHLSTLRAGLEDSRGERRNRRGFKQSAHRKVNVEIPSQARDRLNCHERVSAESEKVIVGADLFDAKKVPPNTGDPYLNLSGRRHETRRSARSVVTGRPSDRGNLIEQSAVLSSI